MTPLLPIAAVRSHRGITAEKVFALVDNGGFRWVWNLSTKPSTSRDLRFLAKEVIAPEQCINLSFEAVVENILGRKRTLASGEIENQFVLSAQTLMRLRRAGEIEQTGGRFTRQSLEAFLIRRLQ